MKKICEEINIYNTLSLMLDLRFRSFHLIYLFIDYKFKSAAIVKKYDRRSFWNVIIQWPYLRFKVM
jgi:hypothetical protein